jgi:hypothetical protein
MRFGLFFGLALVCMAQTRVVEFAVQENAGIERKGVLAEQGIPVPPRGGSFVVLDASGRMVPASVELDRRCARVSLPLDLQPWERKTFVLAQGSTALGRQLKVTNAAERITVEGEGFTATFEDKDRFRLEKRGAPLFDGPVTFQIYSDARSIINAGGKTTVLAGFVPSGFKVEQPSPARAIVTLTGRYPKQVSYSFAPGQTDPKLGFDVDVRFHFSAYSHTVGYDWRLINRCGYKSFLERYALVLPLAKDPHVTKSERSISRRLGRWADFSGAFGVTALFVDDLGEGAGMRVEPAGLLIGGLDMPPDGSLGHEVPEIHRLFYHGMSRTFRGSIVLDSPAQAEASRLRLTLPAQYYSDLGVLPERGDKVNAAEFADAVKRSARWLLDHQWRGTLWWGEWWREWDVARRQGAEEASNGNSLLAPFYHYLRTGDERFLDCAERSASYVFDVQHDKKRSGFGPMLHTRRHLLDELDWIHPRYQRAFGPLLASRVLLLDRERNELIETVRNFSDRIQDGDGTPHDWDERADRHGGETGVDTANFIEALTAAWQESGDPFFLDRARGYARWTVRKWNSRTDPKQWNWNLTRYVLTGMLAICRVAQENPDLVPERAQFLKTTIEISRHTLAHPEYGFVPGTIGDGGLHYFFYHAWLDTEVSRMANDASLLKPLADAVRRQLVRQDASGAFPMDVGALWSQYPTQVISYYDAKAVVAYLPVLGARLAR